ncbi:hemolysin-type calcium binding protein [hydrothermal vent metagenome]|uniref:Hemolysin-type calcium binding protein n=1 Tax=hydrothermal vent metagenome TaxID=652676 RepID=A0A1W1BUF0_9ZZZZ
MTVHLSRALEDGEILEVSVSDTDERTYIFTSGEQDKNLTHSWRGDTIDEKGLDHTAIFIPTATYTGPTEDVKVTLISGKASIYDDDGGKKNNDNDDDDDDRYDPLALDMDKDGFISTSSLDESGTYFDITGDGLRERVGWIQSNDALLTYDKNENGQIDGISEVFGNPGESGFEELKRLIDSNHDNIIDRKDELYTRLQVWNDYNQDAKVQEGELRTLKEAGIKSIDLNYVATNIYIAI